MNSSIPAPFVFSPSEEFDGNDGKWSTFALRIGNPEQTFRVLPAFSTGETLIPLREGCINSDPINCGELRGAYPFHGSASRGFLRNESSTWNDVGLYGVDLKTNLNYSANGSYGLDDVGLLIENSGGHKLSGQVVAGIATKAFYLGLFGLSLLPTNFSDFTYPQRSPLVTLRDEGKIPSLSYGYTAGAYYRNPKALGSLTLGGMDKSRFEPHNISFPFDVNKSRLLSVNIQRISASQTLEGEVSLLDDQTYVEIDSTVPHLWLPRETCDRFARVFGLIYDDATDLYLINSTVHMELMRNDASVTIGLGASIDPTAKVNIEMPYSAFYLQAGHPIYPNSTNYFPIRRGANETQYTLGRAFLQAAYIVVDHERGKFSVHQALFPATNEPEQIESITVPTQHNDTKSTNPPGRSSNMKAGHITGIVIGVVALVMGCLALVFFMQRRNRTKADSTFSTAPIDHSTLSELKENEEPKDGIHEILGEALFEMHAPGAEIDGIPKAELSGETLHEILGSSEHKRSLDKLS